MDKISWEMMLKWFTGPRGGFECDYSHFCFYGIWCYGLVVVFVFIGMIKWFTVTAWISVHSIFLGRANILILDTENICHFLLFSHCSTIDKKRVYLWFYHTFLLSEPIEGLWVYFYFFYSRFFFFLSSLFFAILNLVF